MLALPVLAATPKPWRDGPSQLVLFVTDRCNARCAHCFHSDTLNSGKRLLSLQEHAELAKAAGELLTVSVSGGEPTLRDDLPDLYRLYSERGAARTFFVPTNGLSPDLVLRAARGMLESRGKTPVVFSISLDGPRDLHDAIRGVPGNFDRALDTYRALADLKHEHPKRLRLKVGTVLMNENVARIAELAAFVAREMPLVDFHDFEILRGSPKDARLTPPTVEELEALAPTLFGAFARGAFFGRRRPLASWLAAGTKRFLFRVYVETLRQKRQLLPCLAGRLSAVVSEEGDVSFCELRESVGNLRTAPLADIWRSPRAEATRRSIERGECWCTHSCFQPKNVTRNPRIWPSLALFLVSGVLRLPARAVSRH